MDPLTDELLQGRKASQSGLEIMRVCPDNVGPDLEAPLDPVQVGVENGQEFRIWVRQRRVEHPKRCFSPTLALLPDKAALAGVHSPESLVETGLDDQGNRGPGANPSDLGRSTH